MQFYSISMQNWPSCACPIFSVGVIESFAMRDDGTGYNGMAGTDSWIQFHICNQHGQCCTSQQLHDIPADGSEKYFQVNSGDPCFGLVLSKNMDSATSQTIEIEHFGPDGVAMPYIVMWLPGWTLVFCQEPGVGHIILPDNAGRRAQLSCETNFMFA